MCVLRRGCCSRATRCMQDAGSFRWKLCAEEVLLHKSFGLALVRRRPQLCLIGVLVMLFPVRLCGTAGSAAGMLQWSLDSAKKTETKAQKAYLRLIPVLQHQGMSCCRISVVRASLSYWLCGVLLSCFCIERYLSCRATTSILVLRLHFLAGCQLKRLLPEERVCGVGQRDWPKGL